jgi:hypothetical protein
MEKFKDVTINGVDFRVGLVSALVGDWIITQLTTKTFTDEAIYRSVQAHLLGACSVYIEKDGGRIPLKIFNNGRWLVAAQFPDLESDADTVHQLFEAALDLNVSPFFDKLKARNPDLTQATVQ